MREEFPFDFKNGSNCPIVMGCLRQAAFGLLIFIAILVSLVALFSKPEPKESDLANAKRAATSASPTATPREKFNKYWERP